MPNDETNAKMIVVINDILARSFEEDQAHVVDQWVNTLRHQGEEESNKNAINMVLFIMACLAEGDFKTRFHEEFPWQSPSPKLAKASYLSHARRIIIDFKDLNETQQQETLKYFDTKLTGVTSRLSTHVIYRSSNGEVLEDKSLTNGMTGLFYSGNYGINIATGGADEKNAIGNTITDNGDSGHIFFYHKDFLKALLFGVEQTAPSTFSETVKDTVQIASQTLQTLSTAAASALNYFSDTKLELSLTDHQLDQPIQKVQKGTDQFGQTHSMSGGSAFFTPLESIDFIVPIYRIKCLNAIGCLPPCKKNGMHITLTQDNWGKIQEFLEELNNAITHEQGDRLKQLLLSAPKSAQEKPSPTSCFRLAPKEYQSALDQCLSYSDASEDQKKPLKEPQQNFLTQYEKLSSPSTDQEHCDDGNLYVGIQDAIEKLLATAQSQNKTNNHLTAYIKLIEHIKQLFSREKDLTPTKQDILSVEKTMLDANLQQERKLLATQGKELVHLLIILYSYIKLLKQEKLENTEEISYCLEKIATKNKELIHTLLHKLEQLKNHNTTSNDYPSRNTEENNKPSEDSEEKDSGGWCIYDNHASTPEIDDVADITNKIKDKIKEINTFLSTSTPTIIKSLAAFRTRYSNQQSFLEQLEKNFNILIDERAVLQNTISTLINEKTGLIKKTSTLIDETTSLKKIILTERKEEIELLQSMIAKMQKHAGLLKTRGYKPASAQMEKLCEKLNKAINDNYINNFTSKQDALTQLQQSCRTILSDESLKPLYQHRGYKHVLGNILLAVGLLGVGYAVAITAKKCFTGQWLFFKNPTSVQLIKNTQETLHTINSRKHPTACAA